MNRCPYCGAGGDQPCRSTCDGGYVEEPEPCECGTCDECINEAEAAWERRCEDFYGGSGPMTLDEQHRAAWEQKQELRR